MMDIISELRDVKTVAITGHVRPDGDCVGSVMGLYNYLLANMKQIDVDVYLEQPGEEFSYISNIDMINNTYKEIKEYDVFFVLDCSATDRIEPFIDLFNRAKRTICIDHHISNNQYADKCVVYPEASSTCEVIYGCMQEDKITKEVAECLYTGIVHDTGVFKYSCTSVDTMTIAGKLMARGIDYSDIIDNSFYKKTYAQNKILGCALQKSELLLNGLCIFSYVNGEEMHRYGLDGKQLGGIIEQLRLTDGVEVAIFMYETGKQTYKVSMRSKKYVDVSVIATHFCGGGHVRAAGFNAEGAIYEVVNSICEQISKQLTDNAEVAN